MEPVLSRRWLPAEAGGGGEPRPLGQVLPPRPARHKPIAPQQSQRAPTACFGLVGHLTASALPSPLGGSTRRPVPLSAPHTGTTERLPRGHEGVSVRSWVYGREAGRAGRAVDVRRNRRKVTNSAGRSSTLVAARVASSTSRTVTNTLRRNDLNSDPTVAAPLGRPAPPTSVRPRFLAPLRGFRRRPLRCRSAIHPRPNGYRGTPRASGQGRAFRSRAVHQRERVRPGAREREWHQGRLPVDGPGRATAGY